MLYCNFYAVALYASRMAQLTLPMGRLDRIAMGLSGLCLVHCVATAVLLGLVASAGGLLGKPIVHEVGLTLAMILGSVALVRGILEHGFMMPSAVGGLGLGVMAGALSLPHDGTEAAYTVVGVLILALGHRLNVLASD
jgi:MerC mercury resistance protein